MAKSRTGSRARGSAQGIARTTTRPGNRGDWEIVDKAVRNARTDAGQAQHIEIRIWLRMLSCSTLIENVLKSRLRRDFNTSLARFDVLAQLDRFEHGLTMTELSRRLLVSNGAVTGLVEKLVAEGLVVREDHSTDRRTVIVQLTTEGRALFRKMALRHEEWVISLLGDLSQEARVELLQNLTLLKRRLDDVAGKPGQIKASKDDMLVDEQAS